MGDMLFPRYVAPKFVIGDRVCVTNTRRNFDGLVRALSRDSFHSEWRYTIVVEDDAYASMIVDESVLSLSITNDARSTHMERAENDFNREYDQHRLRLPRE